MFCITCGKNLPEGVAICDNCGTPTSKPAIQQPVYQQPNFAQQDFDNYKNKKKADKYQILGIVFIIFQAMGYFGNLVNGEGFSFINDSFVTTVAGFIGFNVFLIIGIIFLSLSSKYKKK